LIRHATTHFNIEHQKIIHDFGEKGEEFRAFKARRDLVDQPLNEIGLAQCKNARIHINKIGFKVVFVPPMLRTCMTALELFRQHPDRSNIRFIIFPIGKEGANLCNDYIKGPFKT
jgi:broad specificity phosphatase PhoE